MNGFKAFYSLSSPYYMLVIAAGYGIAAVHHQSGVVRNGFIVQTGMIRGDEHHVIRSQTLGG
jgi:hypothetical protein